MAFNLGAAVVKIGADTNPLNKGLAQAKGMFGGMGKGIAGAALKLGAFIGIAAGIKKSISLFIEQDRAVTQLRTSLEQTGEAARLPEVMAFASDLQAITRIGDEATLANIAFGRSLGLSTDQAMKAQQAAIGLATALEGKISVPDAMRAIAKESNGMNSMLGETLPALSGITDVNQRLAIISEAAAKGFEQEQAQAQTFGGQLTQLTNALGDAGEAIGELIAGGGEGGILGWLKSMIELFTEGINIAIKWKTDLIAAFNDSTTAAGSFASGVGSFLSAVVDSFKTVLFTIVNFDSAFAVVAEAATNAFKIVVARVQWFGGNMLKVGKFFFNNWKEIFIDIGNIAVTIFSNLVENAKRLFTGLWEFIKSGGKSGFEEGFKGVTEGFKSSLKENLTLDSYIPPKLNDEAKKHFNDSLDMFLKTEKKKKQKAEQATEEAKKRIGELGQLEATALGQERSDKRNKKKAASSSTGQFKGLTQAWKDAQTQLLKAQDKVPEKQLDALNKLVKGQEKQTEEMKKQSVVAVVS